MGWFKEMFSWVDGLASAVDSGFSWADAHGTGLAALAAIATAVIAMAALRATANDSRERSRPMMVAEFQLAEHNDTAFDLVVRNYGPSVARDVHVSFEPEIHVPDEGGPFVTSYLMSRYQDPIPSLAPAQELRNLWWTGRPGPDNEMINGEPTPDQVIVTINYRGNTRKRYREEFPLTVALLKTTTTSTSASFKGRLQSLDSSLAKVAKAAESIARTCRSD